MTDLSPAPSVQPQNPGEHLVDEAVEYLEQLAGFLEDEELIEAFEGTIEVLSEYLGLTFDEALSAAWADHAPNISQIIDSLQQLKASAAQAGQTPPPHLDETLAFLGPMRDLSLDEAQEHLSQTGVLRDEVADRFLETIEETGWTYQYWAIFLFTRRRVSFLDLKRVGTQELSSKSS